MALKILKTEPFSPSNFSPYYLVLGLRMQMLSSPDLEANASSMVLKILKTEPFSPPKLFPLLPSTWTADANAIRAQKDIGRVQQKVLERFSGKIISQNISA